MSSTSNTSTSPSPSASASACASAPIATTPPPWSTSATAFEWTEALLAAVFAMKKSEKEGTECPLTSKQTRALRLYFEAIDKYRGAPKRTKDASEALGERGASEAGGAMDGKK